VPFLRPRANFPTERLQRGPRILLVGLQIIGPEGEDATTIEFARLLAAKIGGFVPPPAYR
jgi:Asp-tRNA(Asn)/Glu-tRNA(Gln) amidotransferase A subunit family amidase